MEGSAADNARKLAPKILASIFSLENKEKMLRFLVEGGHPSYVEGNIDGLMSMLFVGFEPDPSRNLSDFLTPNSKVIVTPRKEFPPEPKAVHYISVFNKLREMAHTMQTLIHAYTYRETPFLPRQLYEISWYNYFTDEVSLRSLEKGQENAYVIVDRKELLYVRPNNSISAQPNLGACVEQGKEQG
jgi:hypothetical protein